MKIFKGRPGKGKGLVPIKKYKGRHLAVVEARKLEDEGRRPYVQKIGKIGAKLPYALWAKPNFPGL